jgi:hypothetical protein
VIELWKTALKNPTSLRSISLGYVPIKSDEKMHVSSCSKGDSLYWLCRFKEQDSNQESQRLCIYNTAKHKVHLFDLSKLK